MARPIWVSPQTNDRRWQYRGIFRSIRPVQTFYIFIDAITINSHYARIWATGSATRHTANYGIPNPKIKEASNQRPLV